MRAAGTMHQQALKNLIKTYLLIDAKTFVVSITHISQICKFCTTYYQQSKHISTIKVLKKGGSQNFIFIA